MKPFEKTVVITGAGTGIGAACARRFALDAWHVVLVGRRRSLLESLAKDLRSAQSIECDITNEKQLQKIKTEIEKLPIESLCLINNAGIFRRHAFLENHLGNWKEQFETNLFGAVRLTQLLTPIMIQKKKGSIVNVSSTLALQTAAQVSAYSASKAAMNSWTQCLALELASSGIRVNAVCPGLVDTPIHDFHKLEAAEKTENLKRLGPAQPLGRVGTPEEIAESIFFLAGPQSSWTTGSILSVDGGIHLT
ncbi:MAG: SDR family oxidoreductase [Bdellovibrio sp.]